MYQQKDCCIKMVIVIGLMLCMTCGLLFAQQSIIVKSEGEEIQKEKQETEVEKKMKKLISVDFFETPIDDVLRTMAIQADIDIVKNPEVVGDVTASLTDVPMHEALRNILVAHGYAYITSENMVLIVPQSQLREEKEKMVNRVYRITYADVGSVYKSLKSYISKEGELAVNIGTSNLMVTDKESKITAIDAFIEEVDRITPQILIEARIYDITGKNRLDLGVKWNAGTLDKAVSPDPATGLAPVFADPEISSGFSSSINRATSVDGAFKYAIVNSSIDLSIELIAEAQELNAKLLANPRILTVDNELATIDIVTEIPYQELTETSEGGSIGSTDFREVGVMLEVVPHVTRDGMIRLHIRPEFSVATGSVRVGSVVIDNEQPVVDKRRADTITLIKTGETVVIGGLNKREVLQQIDKIPFLGDLPLIGPIFKFEGEEEINSEVLVFITPRIVNDPSMSDYEKCRFEETEFCMPEMTPTIRDREDLDVCDECTCDRGKDNKCDEPVCQPCQPTCEPCKPKCYPRHKSIHR